VPIVETTPGGEAKGTFSSRLKHQRLRTLLKTLYPLPPHKTKRVSTNKGGRKKFDVEAVTQIDALCRLYRGEGGNDSAHQGAVVLHGGNEGCCALWTSWKGNTLVNVCSQEGVWEGRRTKDRGRRKKKSPYDSSASHRGCSAYVAKKHPR